MQWMKDLKLKMLRAATRICHFNKTLLLLRWGKEMFVFPSRRVIYICFCFFLGGGACLIYAQHAHLYYYGLWIRSARINLIESSMYHKKHRDRNRENEREREQQPSQVAIATPSPSGSCQAPSSQRGGTRSPTQFVESGWRQSADSIDWLTEWRTDGHTRLAAIWHCLYRLLIRCTICIYI